MPMTQLTPLAPDIYRLRLPLPFALDHVNCYLIRGDGGWTLLDTGLHTPDGWRHWLAAFAELRIAPNDIEQIVLTHVHPDHYGMAGTLQAWTANAAPVRMSVATAEAAALIWRSPAEDWLDERQRLSAPQRAGSLFSGKCAAKYAGDAGGGASPPGAGGDFCARR